MEASPEPLPRPLMDRNTFLENFKNVNWPARTYLCYEVDFLKSDSWVPLDKFKGFLCNQRADTLGSACHAEERLLKLISTWELDKTRHYRVTCHLSWSPCHDCAGKLAVFLGENSHVRLRIFASRVYSRGHYVTGLCALRAAGAQLAIMTSAEFEYCWETFVDHQGTPFPCWEDLQECSDSFSAYLKTALQMRVPLPPPPPRSP